MASQYSWKRTRYPVGVNPPASHRTPVTATTRHGRRSRTFISINGSVWIGRIGIDTGPFFVAGSGSQIPFFSRSNWARPASVSKKIGRPSYPHAWHTYERLSLSTPAMGPITSSLGWTWPLPHRPHAAKSVGPKRPGIGCASLDADDLHALFFSQAEEGIRALTVTGVQACPLPILSLQLELRGAGAPRRRPRGDRLDARHGRPDPRPDRR